MLQGRGACICMMMHWVSLPLEFLMILWHPRVIVSGVSPQLSVSRFSTFSGRCIVLSCISVSIPSVTRATLYVPSARARPQVFRPAGVSSSCATVVMRKGAFIVFCPSEESLQTSIHSSTYTFFQSLAGWNPIHVQSALCDTFPFPWSYQVLVWHHCHHVLASS